MTQRERILKHLRAKGAITQRQAFRIYGIQRLAARINELRDEGYPIKTDMVTVKTRGGKASIAQYHLLESGKRAA